MRQGLTNRKFLVLPPHQCGTRKSPANWTILDGMRSLTRWNDAARESNPRAIQTSPERYAMTLLRSMIWIVSCTLASAAACAAESRAISVHVLDQVRGQPAATVGVTLEEQSKGADSWKMVAHSTTDEHGRVASLLPAD